MDLRLNAYASHSAFSVRNASDGPANSKAAGPKVAASVPHFGKAVSVELSGFSQRAATQPAEPEASAHPNGAPEPGARPPGQAHTEAGKSEGPQELSEDETSEVRSMKQRDREVRSHEQAHKGSGGSYAGSIQLDLEKGPDGQSYAVSGHVSIDVAPIDGDPQATIAKMAVVRRAAMAPGDPSAADRQVAAKAAAYASEARAEQSKTQEGTEAESTPGAAEAGPAPQADAAARHATATANQADAGAQEAQSLQIAQRAGGLRLVA